MKGSSVLDRCRHCGSTNLKTKRMPEGHTHYARQQCLDCRRVIWLPKPVRLLTNRVVRALVPMALPLDAPLPVLEGTEKQVEFAAKVRALALRRLEPLVSPELFRLMRGITSSGWWISNGDREPRDIRWPETWFEAAEIVGDRRA